MAGRASSRASPSKLLRTASAGGWSAWVGHSRAIRTRYPEQADAPGWRGAATNDSPPRSTRAPSIAERAPSHGGGSSWLRVYWWDGWQRCCAIRSSRWPPSPSRTSTWPGTACPGDRRWAFARPDLRGNGFPWLTPRQRNDLNDYHPCWTELERPDASAVIVRTPADARFDVTAPALAAELGEGVRVMKLDRGTFDTPPLSLITTRTVESLGALLGTDLDVPRFRPNLVIEAFGAAAFPEDERVGRTLTVGTTWMRIDGRDKRCVVVNIDPPTGRRDPGGATRHRHPPGDTPGRVRIDDPSRDGWRSVIP